MWCLAFDVHSGQDWRVLKIVSVVGARPQFVKAAVVSRALRASPEVHEVLVHTGQHYDDNMSALFFDTLDIPKPAYHLGVGSGSHGAQTARMLEAIEGLLITEKPDWVLIYGDTNSTLAGALAAAKLQVPVAHVEAGLRSFNRAMPEELNRIVADTLSTLLLAPTDTAVANLRREGIAEDRIALVGDVMFDAAVFYGAKAHAESRILEQLGLASRSFVLATIHRAENTDDTARLRAIFEGLAIVARRLPVVLPLHPRTRATLTRLDMLTAVPKEVHIIDPVGYLDMVMLEKNAALIATDSGGVQKEAFFFRVPCRTLRDETEWVELVELGWNALVPPSSAEEVAAGLVAGLGSAGRDASPYGDGQAAQRVRDLLLARS